MKTKGFNIFPTGSDVGIITALPDGSANLWMKKPVECGCGRMAMILLNRMGKTYCVVCAPEEPRE